MKKRPPNPVRVSDHAVLRYLERVGGFDIEGLRASISRRVTPAVSLGATGVVIDGFSYRVGIDDWGLVVCTVIPATGTGAILRFREAGE